MNSISRMEQEFLEARQQAMKEAEEKISSLYQNGEETRSFRFDARSCTNGGAEDLWAYLKEKELPHGGDGAVAVWQLTKDQAIRIAMLVDEWNAPWEYVIARRYDVDQMEYYNAFSIAFMEV